VQKAWSRTEDSQGMMSYQNPYTGNIYRRVGPWILGPFWGCLLHPLGVIILAGHPRPSRWPTMHAVIAEKRMVTEQHDRKTFFLRNLMARDVSPNDASGGEGHWASAKLSYANILMPVKQKLDNLKSFAAVINIAWAV